MKRIMSNLIERLEQKGGFVSENLVADVKKYSKYIKYIENMGEKCLISWFNDDWQPIGNMILNKMENAGLIHIKKNEIILLA